MFALVGDLVVLRALAGVLLLELLQLAVVKEAKELARCDVNGAKEDLDRLEEASPTVFCSPFMLCRSCDSLDQCATGR